ncbi:N-acetylmuramoyl-L-alanine amidase [Cereibacter azotoformans]|uniref:N-acetylmuramoyl-L-alanine amidase n=1 Tax=Cereibacter sphaeroides (strain ATCC 17025 / ATH 2.4.3) TaxID=349102 RepID=A4WUQ0_CERS5|nr:N-acetylmuramoyl-L-alanine amidase [Cereibacter azotoformans]ULB10325.1 N-acetylmuramoyl-L-alanine amidase [Cereibacter azotoformans]
MSLSLNHGPRRDGARPDLVVIHYTAMSSAEAACARLCDPAAEVSAHWLISEPGECRALVPEERRAWHAGAGAWGAVTDVNSRSIGIELANPGDRPFPEPQMAALERLLAGILDRWSIPPERVIAHSDMAPGRKIDPGPRFDWRRLARAGLSVWPEPRAPGDFRAAALAFGYPDLPEELILASFRLRFRPWACGPLQAEDAALAADLAARFPVDGRGAAA